MKDKKIILAGGTGFMGQALTRYFGKQNNIIVLTRQQVHAQNNRHHLNTLSKNDLINTKFVPWDGKTTGAWVDELEGSDFIVNLAGRSVNCRYTARNKKEILESRIFSVETIGKAILQCKQPPLLWINASSATIYRDAMDKPQDESSKDFRNDFSAAVCQHWEKSFFDQDTKHTRKVALRMAITLGAGGILTPYFNLLKFGLGGKQGSGKQMYSWVHIEDTCRMIEWIADHPYMEGVYNCTAPGPVANEEFMRTLRKVTGYSIGLPAYTWILKIGALLIGTETELILKSRWVIPTRMLESGFSFKYPSLEGALRNIIDQVPRRKYKLF
jgi:uncharacterized protein